MNKRELPKGWAWAKLGELGKWVGGGTPSKAVPAYWTGGTIPWVSAKDMKIAVIRDAEDHITRRAVSESATNLVPPGAVLFVTRSGILRHTFPVATTAVEVAINQDLKALIPFDGVDPDYVRKAVHAAERLILHECSKDGTTVQSIEFARLQSFQIPLAPSTEQGRVAAAIDALFTRVDAAESSLNRSSALLGRFRRSLLKAAFTGELTADWRPHSSKSAEDGGLLLQKILQKREKLWRLDHGSRKYKTPASADLQDTPSIPETWAWATIEQLSSGRRASLTDGPFGSNLKTKHYTSMGPRVIRLENIGEGIFNDIDTHISVEHYKKLARHHVNPGDVLIASLGEDVPRACLAPDHISPAIVKADCIRMEPSDLLAGNLWIVLALNSSIVRAMATKFVHGVGRPRLSLGVIRQLPIPLPPLSEQKEILNRLYEQLIATSEASELIEERLSQVGEFRQSILGAAFRGELAPQDTSEEAVGELLERIRSRRAAKAAPSKRLPRKSGKAAA